ncbi:MAG TPA: helix-turn-helix transcriptional regulator [Candidatus Nanoarchaeia archaeon]|nr:helix-turn-helix transcriptional regulator [Candidatus Nanoarchaeia archaeon]
MSSAGGDFTWHEVGTRIRDLRAARGISQAQLAREAKLSAPGLFAIEKGDINPQLSSLQRIAKVLGCTVRELMNGPNTKPKSNVDAFFEQARYIMESGNKAAIYNLLGGLETAKLILQAGVDAPSPLFLSRSDEREIETVRQMMSKMPKEWKPKRRRSKGQS